MSRTNARAARLSAAALVFVAALVVFLPAAAAAPGNDVFASAMTITGESGSLSGTNVDASTEAGEPAHAGEPSRRSVWYRWTAPVSGPTVFETCESAFDTLLAAYTGPSVSALTTLDASDDACGNQSRIVFAAAAGTTYSIAVDGYEGETGTFTLRWRLLTPPTNDDFANAQPVAGAAGRTESTTLGASVEPAEPRHAGGRGPSVWFTWTAPRNGVASFETCGSPVDTLLAVYTGVSVSALAEVASNDDFCRGQSRVRFDARVGTTYRIAVAGLGVGDVVLTWASAAPPANDDPRAPRRLRGARGSIAGSNIGALGEGGDFLATVWFRWRAPRTMGVSFDTCAAASMDTLIYALRGSSLRGAVVIDASDDACTETASRVTFWARRGVDYLLAVDGFRGNWGTFTLRWGPAARSDGSCVVPDVRGLTLQRATLRLDQSDCLVGRVVRSSSRIVPRGLVLAQFPNPGTRLRLFGRVSLEISRG